MLVLSRKLGEAVMVGDAMVRILEVRGTNVRLGIEAPGEIKVLREELIGTPPREEKQVPPQDEKQAA